METDFNKNEYIGIVLPDYDPKRQGRYKVHIPELMQHIPSTSGIWCKNGMHQVTNSDNGEYGSAMPLQSGTYVRIVFRDSHFMTGTIVGIKTDWKEGMEGAFQDATKPIEALADRDNVYRIFKTAKGWSALYVNEETSKEPNTMYLIFNRDANPSRRTVMRIDESGVHWWTRDNHFMRIKLSDHKQVDENQSEYIKGWRTKHIDLDDDLKVGQNRRQEIVENDHLIVGKTKTENMGEQWNAHAGSTITITSDDVININGTIINLNCGTIEPAQADSVKPKTVVRDLGPGETSEYDASDGTSEGRPIVAGNKCDEATDDYNTSSRLITPYD